jgi:transposase
MKRYKVTLSDEERSWLERMVSTGRRSAQMLVRARILLKADEAHEAGWTDQEIVEALDVGLRTVERTRQALVEEGWEAALSRQKRSRPGNVKFDGQKEAQLITLACSQAPDGRERWTLQLLADKMVELKVFESISTEAVRQVLKKRAQAVAERAMVYSAEEQCGICLCDGGRPGSLSPAARSQAPAGLYG